MNDKNLMEEHNRWTTGPRRFILGLAAVPAVAAAMAFGPVVTPAMAQEADGPAITQEASADVADQAAVAGTDDQQAVAPEDATDPSATDEPATADEMTGNEVVTDETEGTTDEAIAGQAVVDEAVEETVPAAQADAEGTEVETGDGDIAAQTDGTATEDTMVAEPQAVAAAAATEDTATPAAQAEEQAVAEVDGTTYTSLGDAIKAAPAGSTIKLLADVDMSNQGAVTLADGVTLDLDGHTVAARNSTFFIQGKDITLENGSFTSCYTDESGKEVLGSYGLFIGDSGTTENVTVQNVKVTGGINIFQSTNVVLRDCDVDVPAKLGGNAYYAIWADNAADVTVESGTYKSAGVAVLGMTSQKASGSTLTIKGGTFDSSSARDLVLKGDRLTPVIEGGTFNDPSQVAPYVKEGMVIVNNSNGTGSGTVMAVNDAQEVPDQSGKELLVTDVTPSQEKVIDEAKADPEVVSGLTADGATMDQTWAVNVTLRDKDTHENDSDTRVTVTIPYEGTVDASRYADYNFRVLHILPDGSFVMVDPSSYEATPLGIVIRDVTDGPFVVSYVDTKSAVAGENRPGDTTDGTTGSEDGSAVAGDVANGPVGASQIANATTAADQAMTQVKATGETSAVPALGEQAPVWPVVAAGSLVVLLMAAATRLLGAKEH